MGFIDKFQEYNDTLSNMFFPPSLSLSLYIEILRFFFLLLRSSL